VKISLGVSLAILFGLGSVAHACVWDSKTLWEEKHEHPTLAQAILNPKTETPDVKDLTDRIAKLKANPQTNDPAWWNDFAGAYIRLGQSAVAVKILEPLTNKFAGDYGVHANLGTAYHLLGRYADAEKEIRRDLEINPDAHFGLEKYHLALLQYLSASPEYQLRHVYVDEFTGALFSDLKYLFFGPDYFYSSGREELPDSNELKYANDETKRIFTTNSLSFDELQRLNQLGHSDGLMGYEKNWDLGTNSNLERGVIYMATLNQKQPACWVMLGLLASSHRDFQLAKTAFQKAIDLGSPQTLVLQWQIKGFNELPVQLHIFGFRPAVLIFAGLMVGFVVVVIRIICILIKEAIRKSAKPS
jgi:tetratricopeptide (TPR) repeat protein